MPNTVSLNGDWDFCPLTDPNPPDTLPVSLACEPLPIHVPSSWRWVHDTRFDFQPYDLYNYPRHWNDVPAAFLRRRFSCKLRQGERAQLTFDGVFQRWVCFINGVKIMPQPMVESFLTVTFDITDRVRQGENELVVWCGAWEKIETASGKKLCNPNGSWFADLSRGIWQEVRLETRPSLAIADVFVRTSTRMRQIFVEVKVGHRASREERAELRVEILEAGKVVRAFPEISVALASEGEHTFSLEADWPDAKCWSPQNPYLYDLRVILVPDDGTADERAIRFGFREVWFDGPKFYLNGVRTNLRGDAWHYQGFVYQTPEYARNWYAMVKAAGMNFVRLHAQPYPSFFLDIADEMGMLIVDESAIYGSSKTTQSDDPEFLAACREHLERLVRRDRNHPSVILWSMQNEMRWVDGREGYRDAMPALTNAVRALDPTRPVIYDGDMRLVPPEWCDAFSLHYNIDGTVDQWVTSGRQKPLLFGEHGAFHYVSPQVSADLGGQAAYLRFADAMAAIGENERLFIEYARRNGVTGVTPFNLVNYALWTLPPNHHASLPNDCLGGSRPNPAYAPVAEACAPVTILPDQLNRVFFAGPVDRSFSIFNDTEHKVFARLEWSLTGEQGMIEQGEFAFWHEPGVIYTFRHTINFPAGQSKLSLQLLHDDHPVIEREMAYRAFPKPRIVHLRDNMRIAIFGEEADFERMKTLVPSISHLKVLNTAALQGVGVLVLGERLRIQAEEAAPVLDAFVRAGGALLVLEQDQLVFGELTLSGRKFFAAHPNTTKHPIMDGLQPDDLRFWSPDSPHSDDWQGLVQNAFLKPVDGDIEILLECAEGSFGWGGLLWSPLVSYRLGKGRAVFCQLALGEYFESAPQAAILLSNLLRWLATPTGPLSDKFNQVELLNPEAVRRAEAGETVLLPPLVAADAPMLQSLFGEEAQIFEADTYQLALVENTPGPNPFHGVSAHDLFHIERVTYTPHTYHNRVIAQHAFDLPGALPLLQDVHNPWHDFFINGMDGESIKMAVATQNHDSAGCFTPRIYAARLPVGKGALIFCQILQELDNPKVRRIYNRLMANIGAAVESDLFTRFAPARERGITAFMGLMRQSHQDESAMRTYFCSPTYTLNNLGEGVYGWMLRLEQRNGVITIPDSAGQTWFLTVFIDSEINRDPSLRDSGVLPDPSIVPDLWVESNASTSIFLNGTTLLDEASLPDGGINAGDAILRQGINRLVILCHGGQENIRLSAWLLTKFGEPVSGVRTTLTLD